MCPKHVEMCQELCFSVSSACERHFLIAFKWIIVITWPCCKPIYCIVRPKHLYFCNLGYLMSELRVCAMMKKSEIWPFWRNKEWCQTWPWKEWDSLLKSESWEVCPDQEQSDLGLCQANLVLIAYASSDGSGEPAHLRSLARTSAAHSYMQWVKTNPSDRKPDPWPLSMAGHAQLKLVMTECSKTQICLTWPIWVYIVCLDLPVRRLWTIMVG